MIRRRIGYLCWLLTAASLYFFENNTGTRAVLLASILVPAFSVFCAYRTVKKASVSLRAPEPILSHDDLAGEPSAFLAACSLAAFLLRNSRPMVSLPDTFRALSRMLTRTAEMRTAMPWLSYVKLVFLCENGLVSVPPDRQNFLDSVTEFAVGIREEPPLFPAGSRERFVRWIEDMAERCSVS